MELYTLDQNFQPIDIVDDFISLVWVERYTKNGDVNLVVEPTAEMIAKIPEDTFLQIKDSEEIMHVETVLIEDGLMKVTGRTLDHIFEDRFVQIYLYHDGKEYWDLEGTPSELMGDMVEAICVTGTGDTLVVDQTIPYLTLGDIDSGGDSIKIAIPYGTLASAIQALAESYSIGYSLFLYGIDPGLPDGYTLKFKTYIGRDLTSDQTTYPVVQFSPNMDNLTDTKILKSKANYKNTAVVFAPKLDPFPGIDDTVIVKKLVYVNDADDDTHGFDRRMLFVIVNDIEMATEDGDPVLPFTYEEVLAILEQRGKDALAKYNHINILDGEVLPNSGYTYGVDYKLGDIVELDSGELSQKARITEYIRSQDKEGERAYPTVSVLS